MGLPKHPIPMRTLFRECFLVNFAVDPDVMRSLIPAPLAPDIHAGKAYLSIVIADMEKMRPAFLPKACGVSYTQVVYRAVIRYGNERGVHFLRSDADNRLMCAMGNLLTFFRFTHSRIRWTREGSRLHFHLLAPPGDYADIHACYHVGRPLEVLPATSRFHGLIEAQRFLVELFAAYAVGQRHVSRVRIRRGHWDVQVVRDECARYDFMNGSELFPRGSTELDSVFHVRNLPYYWDTLETVPLMSEA